MAEVREKDATSSVGQIVDELAADFQAMPKSQIEALVQGSFGELADGARIDTYLPVLTKRLARERLRHSA